MDQWCLNTHGLLSVLLYWSVRRRTVSDRLHCKAVLQAVIEKTVPLADAAAARQVRPRAGDCACFAAPGQECKAVKDVQNTQATQERLDRDGHHRVVAALLIECASHMECPIMQRLLER